MNRKQLNRREFLGRAASGIFSAGVGIPLAKTAVKRPLVTSSPKIITRTLGRTGLKIPVVSFGVMNSDSPELLHKALDMGIRHLDTAHIYLRGNSERFIGQVVEEAGMRDRITIATKMRFNRDREKHIFLLEGVEQQPGATIENFNLQLEESLRRLRTDYIDILYLHSCYSPAMATFEPLMKAMILAKEAGKARFIGISTHRDEPNVIRAGVDAGIYDVVLTSYNYLQEHHAQVKAAMDYAAQKGLGVVVMKTQGGVQVNREKKIEVNHKAALKWALAPESVSTAIPGITTFEQMDTDFSVMENLQLDPSEKRDLKLTSMISGGLFCQNCRQCIPGCPSRVEIPVLMRAYMYARGYGNMIQAETTVQELTPEQGLPRCSECSSCSAECRRGIPIPSRIARLQQIFG